MACLGLFAAILLLAAPPTDSGSGETANEGRLVDLTGDLTADVLALDPGARGSVAHFVLCGGEAPPRALLGQVRIGALLLTRDAADGQPSSRIVRPADDAVLLDSRSLAPGISAGLDFTLITVLSEANELELRYFGIDGWNASQSQSSPGGVRFDGFGVSLSGESQRSRTIRRGFTVSSSISARGLPKVSPSFSAFEPFSYTSGSNLPNPPLSPTRLPSTRTPTISSMDSRSAPSPICGARTPLFNWTGCSRRVPTERTPHKGHAIPN